MKTEMSKHRNKGVVLFVVIVFASILTILGFATLRIASNEAMLTQQAINKAKAFYAAEAALAMFTVNAGLGQFESINETSFDDGTYKVDYYHEESPSYAIATGSVNGQEKSIKVRVRFLAPPYECGAYAGNKDGTAWSLVLRGTGNPISVFGGEYGGKDIINGNLFAAGDVHLYEEASVNPALDPNPFGLNGDVEATGTIETHDGSSIAGTETEGVDPYANPDLVSMNYAINNTHNVSQIFADEGVTQGTLPEGHELRDVFQINPSNMSSECATTPGNDYFLTPSSISDEGTWKTAEAPINVGEDRVYYIDGDLWIHSKSTYGFDVEGKVTIVVTGDIHICDNLEYADLDSMLGLIALGKYDGDGDLISGGNVYFGDPVYGTLYTASAMMFAANDFLYNTDPISAASAEPDSGFTIYGSLIGLNQVKIERDWYTKSTYWNGWKWVEERAPARYDPATDQWRDSETEEVLTEAQINSIKHYQMVINYDDRVRTTDTQPPGLPRGEGTIFDGLSDWEEVSI